MSTNIKDLFICVSHTRLRGAWGQGPYVIAICTPNATPACHIAVNTTQQTGGSNSALVKMNDLERADTGIVKCFPGTQSFQWKVDCVQLNTAGGEMSWFPYLTESSQHAAKHEEVQVWRKRSSKTHACFILIPLQDCVSEDKIPRILMLWKPLPMRHWQPGEGMRSWASLSCSPGTPGSAGYAGPVCRSASHKAVWLLHSTD